MDGKIIKPDLITEKMVEKEIKQALKKAGIWHWKHWGGGYNPKGIPDILGIYPANVLDLLNAGIERAGIFLGIEVKRPGGKPTREQADWLAAIKKNAGIGFYTDNPHRVIKYLGLIEKAHPLFGRVLGDEEQKKDP